MTSATPESSSRLPRSDFALVAGNPDGGALRARHRMRAESHLLDVFADRLDLFRRGLRLHHD